MRVDLLVGTPNGLHPVEIKNYKGTLTNDGSTWILDDARRRPPFDTPVHLADRKAKEPKSLLADAARGNRLKVPYVTASIFLAEPGSPTRSTTVWTGSLGTCSPPTAPQKSISVGPWRIEPQPYESGPTWQDHHATRPDSDAACRRVRIYLYERENNPERRESVRLTARREFGAGQGIAHPGLLVPHELLDHEMGPALLVEQDRHRFAGVEDFLEWLDLCESGMRASVHPAPEPDPYEAAPDDLLPDGSHVLRVLGTGATAPALLVGRGDDGPPC